LDAEREKALEAEAAGLGPDEFHVPLFAPPIGAGVWLLGKEPWGAGAEAWVVGAEAWVEFTGDCVGVAEACTGGATT
jgi:hypothetical protein